MESDDFTRHNIIRYLSACELVLPPPPPPLPIQNTACPLILSVLHVSMSVMVASQGFVLEVKFVLGSLCYNMASLTSHAGNNLSNSCPDEIFYYYTSYIQVL